MRESDTVSAGEPHGHRGHGHAHGPTGQGCGHAHGPGSRGHAHSHGHGHSHGHLHALPSAENERRLAGALALTTVFLVGEVIGGVLTGSLALLSDAAHMFTDTAALAIALAAVRVGRRPADDRRTYGYRRFEILAAAFNALLLFVAAGAILYEAWRRLHTPAEVHSLGMLVVAVVGLAVNLASMRLLVGGAQHSVNVRSAYLEVWSDMLGSVGVIAGALLIRATGWAWIDSVIAVGIGLWVLPRTWTLLKETTNVLLEGVPAGLDLADVRATLEHAPGVHRIHDLHVWSISTGRPSLTAHVVYDPRTTRGDRLLGLLRGRLRERHDIDHVTLQLEEADCGQGHDHALG